MKSLNLHSAHNVFVLMYHFVFSTKYSREVIDGNVYQVIAEICYKVSKRYTIRSQIKREARVRSVENIKDVRKYDESSRA